MLPVSALPCELQKSRYSTISSSRMIKRTFCEHVHNIMCMRKMSHGLAYATAGVRKSKWPPSARTQAWSLSRHCWIASSTIFCWNSATLQPAAAAVRLHPGLAFGRHVPAWRPRCGNPPGLGPDCWQATCQDRWTPASHVAEARLCHERDELVRCLAGGTRTHHHSPAMLRIAGSNSCISNTSR